MSSLPPAAQRLLPELVAELRGRVSGQGTPLFEMLRQHLGGDRGPGAMAGGSPHLHGVLCLLACEAAGGGRRAALPAAAAVEMAAGSALVHDEIRWGAPAREGRPSLWWTWGHAQGINAGDGLYALARLAVMDLPREGATPEATLGALRALDEACQQVCERRAREIDLEARAALTVQEYLWAVEGQEGALTGAACALGAMVASAPEATAEGLRDFGRWAGAAHRLRRDMDGLWGAARDGSNVVDALDRRRSLPLIHAFQYATGADRRRLEALAAREEPLGDARLGELMALLDRCGARAFAEATTRRYLDDALEALRASRIARTAAGDLEAMARSLAGAGPS